MDIHFGDGSSECGDDDDNDAAAYAYDKRRRLAYHPDGDDSHSVASNQRLNAHNARNAVSTPSLGGRVLVLNGADDRMDELFPSANDNDDDSDDLRRQRDQLSPEDKMMQLIRQVHYHPENALFRDEFIRKLRLAVDEMLNLDSVNRLVMVALNVNVAGGTELQKLHSTLIYIYVSCNYCLSFADSDCYLRGRFTSQLRAAVNIITRVEQIINTAHDVSRIANSSLQQDGPALVLQCDSYHYANLTKGTGKQGVTDAQVVEALVYKALEIGKYALLFDTSDGGSGNDHRVCDTKFEIFVLQRAHFFANGSQQCTHFYGKLFKFDRFVHYIMQQTIIGRQVSLSAVETFIKRNMGAPDNLLTFAPRVMYNRNLVAFPNGVYVLDQDRFYSNDEELPPSLGICDCVPRIFHPVNFPYDEYAHARIDKNEFADETRTAAIMSDIPTPALDRIIHAQQWPPSVQLIVYALVGRLLHPLHGREEKLPMLIYLYGLAGTGKTTLCKLGGRMLSSCRTMTAGNQCVIETSGSDSQAAIAAATAGQRKLARKKQLRNRDDPAAEVVGPVPLVFADAIPRDCFSLEIENRVEENFPLQNIIGKLAWSMSEIQIHNNFPRSTMLKMVARDLLTITRKNQVPVEILSNAAGWLAGNTDLPWKDTQGEIERRMLILHFVYMVAERDGQLDAELDREMAYIIMKCNRIYLAWAKYAADKDIYAGGRKKGAVPSYFEGTRSAMMSKLSKAAMFWNTYIEEGMLIYRPGDKSLTCTMPQLCKHFRQFLQSQQLLPTLSSSNNSNNAPGAHNSQRAPSTNLPGSLKNDLTSLLKRRHIVDEGINLFGLQLVEPAGSGNGSAAP